MKDTVAAALILQNKSAKDIKKLGAGVKINEQWDRDKIDVMRFITKEKFVQNPALCQKLINTGQQQLIEATTDPFWGAKATFSSKSLKNSTWTGGNMLGKILSEIRDDIRRESNYQELSNAPVAPTSQPPPSGSVVANQRSRDAQGVNVNKDNQQEDPGHGSNVNFNRRRGKKNKNRPSSSSSVDDGTQKKEDQSKQQRIFSPTSALPPPRLLYSDLFNSDVRGHQPMDEVTTQQTSQATSS